VKGRFISRVVAYLSVHNYLQQRVL
jgi:hypothetical protein